MTHPHVDGHGTGRDPGTTGLEAALHRAGGRPRYVAGAVEVDPARLLANRRAIDVEIDAPPPTALARVLRRLGVRESVLPLVTATPGLRRSWLVAVIVALLFALNAASQNDGEGIDKIVVFLTVAPLVPLLGVALAFGKAVDPTHEIVVAAPMDSFRVFLVRAVTVLTASTAILLTASLLVRDGGAARVAWLLPALAATSAALALATRIEPRAATGLVAAGWVGLVVVVSQASGPGAAFGPVAQLSFAIVAVSGAALFFARRRRLDQLMAEQA